MKSITLDKCKTRSLCLTSSDPLIRENDVILSKEHIWQTFK